LGLGPEIYYVPVTVVSGPPYGRALGHYKKKHRKQWSTIVLSDADVVNLVELRFLSEHHRVAPERIIELRGGNRDFVAIHAHVRGGKADTHREVHAPPHHRNPSGKQGRGRGHGKGN
jgi:hypothetical protein